MIVDNSAKLKIILYTAHFPLIATLFEHQLYLCICVFPVTGAERGWLAPGPDFLQTTPMVNATSQIDADHRGNTDDSRRSRPTSMLYYDSGFVRFRQDGDSEGDPLASTDEELDCENGPPRYRPVGSGSDVHLNGSAQLVGDNRMGHLYHNRTRNGQWRSGSRRNGSVPNTGRNTPSGWHTPATPRSLCSPDIDGCSGVFSFRPPSSIHLRDSIEKELNFSDSHFRTPDDLLETVDSIQESISLPRSPDALRASVYSYATAAQESRSDGMLSLSPGRKLYSAQSFVTSSPSLSYNGLEMSGSGWFQRYFWDKFGDNTHTFSTDSVNKSLCGDIDFSPHKPSLPPGNCYSRDSPAQTPTSGATRGQCPESCKRNNKHYCQPK